ncbi:hypothetical protein, partial [Paracoccus rhizosphaerae]|uniref:hypothetical protein n=1 Tax=Paracoccus rhizosphaerae TaxID=1133347 RepID=UPI00223F7EDF
VLLQNADDLIFSEPAALHLWSYRLGQSLSQTGLGGGGNVRHDQQQVPVSLRPAASKQRPIPGSVLIMFWFRL